MIRESGMPTWAAVEAAPMRKLWPLKPPTCNPALLRVSRTFDTNCTGQWSAVTVDEQGPSGQIAMYARTAATGHNMSRVRRR